MVRNSSAQLASTVAKAYQGGIETSLKELASHFQLLGKDPLTAAADIVYQISTFELELVPGIEEGEFETPRVLRPLAPGATSADYLHELIASGEGARLEFKSSLLCSMYHLEAEKKLYELPTLPGEVLKTVCAFLNTDGGELLVGIDDDGSPCGGIQHDLVLKGWNLDKWQLHLTALIESRFHEGKLVAPFIKLRILSVESTPVAQVTVMARNARSFVRREKNSQFEFFVRNGSRTDSLDLPGFNAHLEARMVEA